MRPFKISQDFYTEYTLFKQNAKSALEKMGLDSITFIQLFLKKKNAYNIFIP